MEKTKTNYNNTNTQTEYEAPAIVKQISASDIERESHYAGTLLPSGTPPPPIIP